MALRVVAAAIAYLVCFAAAYGLLLPAAPAAADGGPLSPGTALLLMAGLNTAVVAWLILRSRPRGWRLAAWLIPVFYGVQTVLPQIESYVFQASPGYARHMPVEMVPRILAAGLLHALAWIPLAILLLGRWRGQAQAPAATPLSRPLGEWTWKLAVAAAAYVVLYFTFGYYVAWRNPAVPAYYQGTDPGTFLLQLRSVLRDTPWLPAVQLGRGLLWAALALAVLRLLRAPAVETAAAMGALFALMSAGLLLPNPYMPYEVRMAHLLETASSNFLFGVLLVALFRPRSGA